MMMRPYHLFRQSYVVNNINSYMSSTRLYITTMEEQHLDQAADVLTRSFIELNTIWK